MKKFLLKSTTILCSLMIAASCLSEAAQPTWGKTDNKNGSAADVAYDSFGNAYYASSAQASPTSSIDIRIIKYSSKGVLLGTVYYDYHNLNDYPTKIKIDASNNIYVLGSGKSNVGPFLHDDALLLKYNSSLVLQWATHENSNGNGDDVAVDMDIDKYGTIYVLCSFKASTIGTPDYDIGYFAIQSNGTNQHGNYFNDSTSGTNQIAKRIKVSTNGVTVWVCGANQNTTYGYDGLLLRINGSLGVSKRIDFRSANNNSYDCFNDFDVDTNANMILWGESQINISPNNYLTRPFIVKYDFAGNYLWNNSLINTTSEYAVKVFTDAAQNHIGITSAGRFVKFDGSKGTIIKNKSIVGKTVVITDAEINKLGQVYTCGYVAHTNIYSGDSTTAYLAKLTKNGVVSWESQWMAPQFTTEEGNSYKALAVNNNRIYVIGAHYFNTAYELLMQCYKPSGLLRETNDEDRDEEAMSETSFEKSGIEITGIDLKLEVYPNPATDFVNVHINVIPESKCQLILIDETGKIVKQQSLVDTDTKIDFTTLATGKYFITVKTEDGKVKESLKVMKIN